MFYTWCGRKVFTIQQPWPPTQLCFKWHLSYSPYDRCHLKQSCVVCSSLLPSFGNNRNSEHTNNNKKKKGTFNIFMFPEGLFCLNTGRTARRKQSEWVSLFLLLNYLNFLSEGSVNGVIWLYDYTTMKTVFVYPEVFVGLKENIGSSANQANVLCATRFMGLTRSKPLQVLMF